MSPRGARAVVTALTTARVFLGGMLLVLASAGRAGPPYVFCCVAALLTDVYDGVLARRYGVDTAGLRRYDSLADTVFWLAAAGSVWILHPEVLTRHAWLLGALLTLEVGRHGFDFLRFGREAAYHAWSARLWGVSLFAALIAVMGLGKPSPWVGVALTLGLVADLEGLMISAILPVWTHDVKSIVHAWRLRRRHLTSRT